MIMKLPLHFCAGVVPTAYEDTLSFYELLKLMGFKINEVVDYVNDATTEALVARLRELFVNVVYDEDTETAILSFDDSDAETVENVIKYFQIENKRYPVSDPLVPGLQTAVDAHTSQLVGLNNAVVGLQKLPRCNYHSIGPDMAHPTPSGVTVHYSIYVGQTDIDSEVSDEFEYSDAKHCYATLERAFQDWDEHTDNCYISVCGMRDGEGEFVSTTYYVNRRTFAGGQLHFLVHSPGVTIEWGTDSSNYDHLIYNMYLHISGYVDRSNPTAIDTTIIYRGKKQGFYLEGCSITSSHLNIKDGSVNHDVRFGHAKCFIDVSNNKYFLPFYAHHCEAFIGQDTTFAPSYDSDEYAAVFSKGGSVTFDNDSTSEHPIKIAVPSGATTMVNGLGIGEIYANFSNSYLSFIRTSGKNKMKAFRAFLQMHNGDVSRIKESDGGLSFTDCLLNGKLLESSTFAVGTTLATSVSSGGNIERPNTDVICCAVTSGGNNYRIPCYIGGAQTGYYYATMPKVDGSAVISIKYRVTNDMIEFSEIKDGTTSTTIARVTTA